MMPIPSISSAISSTAGRCNPAGTWPQSHNDFVQKMLRKARKGAKVVYVPGNHDEFLRNYYGTHFAASTSWKIPSMRVSTAGAIW